MVKILVTLLEDWVKYEFRDNGELTLVVLLKMDAAAGLEDIYDDHERCTTMEPSHDKVSQN